MYRTVFDQRLRGLFRTIEHDSYMITGILDEGEPMNSIPFYSAFTAIDKAAIFVAEAYKKIDPLFSISDFCSEVSDFSMYDLYGVWTGQKECWALKLPLKTEMHPVDRVPHSESGPAIVWRDESRQYFLYGVKFTKEIWERIVQKKITVNEVGKWQDIDKMRAALRYLGPEELLNQCPARLVDRTAKGNRLYNIEAVASLTNVKILVYNCPSTGIEYHRFVKDWMSDADYAQAWRYKMSKEDYLKLTES